MTTIIAGQDVRVVAAIRENGKPITIPPGAEVKAQLLEADGATPLFNAVAVAPDVVGADWSKGLVSIPLSAGETASLPRPSAILAVIGPGWIKRFSLDVRDLSTPDRSALFIKDVIVDELRQDRLALMASSLDLDVDVSDDLLWQKVLAAEAFISHELRVPLAPTKFFPNPPTNDQLAALNGTPWAIDPAYDYDPEFFRGEKWGFLVTRQKPIISVERVMFVYPAPTQGFYEIPGDWLRMDRKFGHIRFVPASSPWVAPLNAFIMQAMGGGRTIPFALEVTYTAGLEDAGKLYPDLLDAVKKVAVLKMIEDAFIPQSGSISADGLSQSMSADMAKYRETVDVILNGPKGSNGGLMTAIHGVRMGYLGA